MTTKPKKPNNLSWMIIIGIACVIVFGIAFVMAMTIFSPSRLPPNPLGANIQQQNDYDGITIINPPRAMPDFTLTSQHNTPISLHELVGQPTLMFFGYTYCPDICPLTLNEFQQIRDGLGNLGDRVNFVFISVDGDRDTPARIADYFETRRVEDFIGLTGEEADIRRIGADYGLHFQPAQSTKDAANYLVDHTSSAFLLDASGKWIRKYAFGTAVATITNELRELLRSSTPDTDDSYTLPRL